MHPCCLARLCAFECTFQHFYPDPPEMDNGLVQVQSGTGPCFNFNNRRVNGISIYNIKLATGHLYFTVFIFIARNPIDLYHIPVINACL